LQFDDVAECRDVVACIVLVVYHAVGVRASINSDLPPIMNGAQGERRWGGRRSVGDVRSRAPG
jgi:hypothetical protein